MPFLAALSLLTATPASAAPLKTLASSHQLLIGSAVRTDPLEQDAEYRAFITKHFSVITPENAFKFEALQPERGKFDFAEADRLVEFARKHGIKVRGHTLLWHHPGAFPAWIKEREKEWTPAEAKELLEAHVRAVITHFRKQGKGTVFCFDVANELIGDQGEYRKDTLWARIAPDPVTLLDQVFRWARAADPSLKLFYNDYGIEMPGKKADAALRLLEGLKKKKTPIDGLGLQMHFSRRFRPDYAKVETQLRKYAGLGLTLHVTEFDYAIPDGDDSAETLKEQADAYAGAIRACLKVKACKAFVTWGFTDRVSYFKQDPSGEGRAFLLDEKGVPKPAFHAVESALRQGRR